MPLNRVAPSAPSGVLRPRSGRARGTVFRITVGVPQIDVFEAGLLGREMTQPHPRLDEPFGQDVGSDADPIDGVAPGFQSLEPPARFPNDPFRDRLVATDDFDRRRFGLEKL